MKLINQDRKYPFQYSINKFAQLSHYCFVLLHLAADTEAAVENTKKNGFGSSLSCWTVLESLEIAYKQTKM